MFRALCLAKYYFVIFPQRIQIIIFSAHVYRTSFGKIYLKSINGVKVNQLITYIIDISIYFYFFSIFFSKC